MAKTLATLVGARIVESITRRRWLCAETWAPMPRLSGLIASQARNRIHPVVVADAVLLSPVLRRW